MDEKQNLRSQIASLSQPSPYSESQKQQFTTGQVSIGAPVSRAEFEELKREIDGVACRAACATMALAKSLGKDVEECYYELMKTVYNAYSDATLTTEDARMFSVLSALTNE